MCINTTYPGDRRPRGGKGCGLVRTPSPLLPPSLYCFSFPPPLLLPATPLFHLLPSSPPILLPTPCSTVTSPIPTNHSSSSTTTTTPSHLSSFQLLRLPPFPHMVQISTSPTSHFSFNTVRTSAPDEKELPPHITCIIIERWVDPCKKGRLLEFITSLTA